MEQVIDSFSSIANTEKGIYLGDIKSDLPLVTPFPQKLKKYHLFCFSKKGQIWCKERWDEGTWILQTIKERTQTEQEKKKRKQLEMSEKSKAKPLWNLTKEKLRTLIGNHAPVPSKTNKEGLIKIINNLGQDVPAESQPSPCFTQYNPCYSPFFHQQVVYSKG